LVYDIIIVYTSKYLEKYSTPGYEIKNKCCHLSDEKNSDDAYKIKTYGVATVATFLTHHR